MLCREICGNIMLIYRLEARYQKVIMRARFDANKDEKDKDKAQLLLVDGCRQLWEKRHTKPFRCQFTHTSLTFN